jgi:hypothetical protein
MQKPFFSLVGQDGLTMCRPSTVNLGRKRRYYVSVTLYFRSLNPTVQTV